MSAVATSSRRRLLARALRRDKRCQGRIGIVTHRHGCATVLFPSAQRCARAAGTWIKKDTVKNPHLRLPYPTACSHGLTASPGSATTQTEKSTQVHTSNPSSASSRTSPCGVPCGPCHTALPGYRCQRHRRAARAAPPTASPARPLGSTLALANVSSGETLHRFRGQLLVSAATTLFLNTPTPSTSTSTVSHGFIAFVLPGVPVKMRSPGNKVIYRLT